MHNLRCTCRFWDRRRHYCCCTFTLVHIGWSNRLRTASASASLEKGVASHSLPSDVSADRWIFSNHSRHEKGSRVIIGDKWLLQFANKDSRFLFHNSSTYVIELSFTGAPSEPPEVLQDTCRKRVGGGEEEVMQSTRGTSILLFNLFNQTRER